MIEPNSPLRSRFSGPAATLRLALLLGLVSLYLSLSTMPTASRSTVSLALALASVMLALRTRTAQKSEPIKVRIISALLVGTLAAFVGALSLGAGILLHTELTRYEECTAGAITHASATICQDQLRKDLNSRISRLRPATQKG
jgi:ABC-type proline/glycine betaine transport system permease subunit